MSPEACLRWLLKWLYRSDAGSAPEGQGAVIGADSAGGLHAHTLDGGRWRSRHGIPLRYCSGRPQTITITFGSLCRLQLILLEPGAQDLTRPG